MLTIKEIKYENITTKFSLYCEDSIYQNILQSLIPFITIIGCPFISQVSDRKGRRYALILGTSLTWLGFVIYVMSPNLIFCIIANVFIGLSIIGTFNLNFSILSEIGSAEFR